MTTKGQDLLKLWDNIYMVQGMTGAMANMLPKAEKALDATVEVLYTSRYSGQQESIQKLIKNTLYSFPLRNYSKNGLKVLSKASVEKAIAHSSDFEKLRVLFVENAAKEIGVLHKGRLFFQGKSPSRTDIFLDYVYRKAGGNIAKLEEEFSRLAGMAENLTPHISLTVEEFKAGLKVLEETEINAENAIDYIYDVLPYFNHRIFNNEVVMISDSNCVNVVQKVIEYLETGNISQALHSAGQDVEVLEQIYKNNFSSPVKIEDIRTIDMAEGEIGIMYIYKKGYKYGHVFNVIKINKRLMLLNGQKGLIQTFEKAEFVEYLKVKQLK